ncbi:MAG: peptidoglycan-binding domain-containing protein [Bacteroidia bacterium]
MEEYKISQSVGNGGQNIKADVITVQTLLVKVGYMAEKSSSGKSNIDGICGNGTIGAITNFQLQKVGNPNPDGRIDPGGKTWKVLLETVGAASGTGNTGTSTPAIQITPEVIAAIKKKFPSGLNVCMFALYDDQSNNNQEFGRAAAIYINDFSSVGIDGNGVLKLGHAYPVRSLTDATSILKTLHEALKKDFLKSAGSTSGNTNVALPAYLKVKTLALLAHGMPWGINLGREKKYNLRIDSADGVSKFKQFVAGIRPYLTEDVNVPLFSCNAGRESDGTEPEGVWYLSEADKQDGNSSFAAAFAAELGANCSCYGHLSAGHTVNNFSARVFGKDAGRDATKDKRGVHIFHLLYPTTFSDAEAARLKKDKAKVRDKMWAHFKDRMDDSHQGQLLVKNSDGKSVKIQLGSVMFTDLPGASRILQADWPTWVAANPI